MPFCGSEAKILTPPPAKGIHHNGEFGVYCSQCYVTSPRTDYQLELELGSKGQLVVVKDERPQALEAWNRRANDETD